ncbi:SH3 domain-containing protein [Pleomorphomonas sp. PLEO]|uniref:SH3 domain-containing protein n=1 Tax=Pleomorphomonas sp. PLEO TaxID=3239306 RepID=UPI00351F3B94
MSMRRLAAPLCLVGLISSTTGALAAPAEVLAAVNLRTGPGAQYYPIVVLPPGTPVNIYGCLDDDSWCDVGYGNTRGWLASRYLGTVRNWSAEQQIMRPPVFSPPPIYREPPVYANPPPVYRQPPVYGDQEWPQQEEAYPGNVYIEPPPAYVYRQPPVTAGPPMPDLPQPNVEVYRPKPQPQAARPTVVPPPVVASTPPITARPAPTTAPSVSVTQPSTTAPSPTQPATSQPATSQPATPPSQSVATSSQPAVTATPPATVAKPKYGGAVGKPGAPCKWVNGVCRND